MSEKQGFKLKKNQIIGASVAALLLIGGGSVYAVNSQKKAQAEKIELAEKKEKEDYKKLSLQVDDSVKKAYDTRSAKDIEMAETIIKKLKEQDQKDPKTKMTKLHSFLDLIKKTDQLLATAEKSKKDSDIKAAQNSINEEKDEYLKKDKEAHQKRLDKLKQVIKEQKDKESKEKSEKEKAQKAEEQKQQSAAGNNKENATNPAQENKAQNEAANGTPANNTTGQAEQPQAPAVEQPVEQPQAPVDNGGGAVTPEQPNPTPPVDNGGGNSGGGNTGGGNVTPPPSNEYDPMTPVGSGGLFGSAAEATAVGQAKALELSKQGQGDYRVVTWEVKYTDGRSAGWTYELAI
ncbi:hypothetical protein [Enterococcus faecalis]|uniref:hypothetical protein n=1 Tax=Enterococcus faecalis TaxID=1351 RepID=UPI00032FF5F0|nr:hypothetical protein [Enterococcus faecalis]EOK35911.1 hypothetical protein WUI_03172 [Enterococcus faecalis EnGen0335]EOL91586.1 hypothetical protein WM1_03114 [Enterococcus faecalis EnGen0341]